MRAETVNVWLIVAVIAVTFVAIAAWSAWSAQTLKVKRLQCRIDGLEQIVEQRKSQFPWLATALADFHALDAEQAARGLETKKWPARQAAQQVREHGRKKQEAERMLRIIRYRVEYYERLFPWITEYVGDDVPDDVVAVGASEEDSNEDPVSRWLSPADYKRLSPAKRNQMALDRWRVSPKTRWEIGREYERFIGYTYESKGYDVIFSGAIEGMQDMGRDVIARRNSELRIIQCKYWSQEKVIREKHIFQLFGSSLEYAFKLNVFANVHELLTVGVKTLGVTPVLYTSTRLSDVAREVAKKLGVECNENIGLPDYPLVKCNISQRDGGKIYHLPFDQQYDRTKIKPDGGERYVYSVADAEKAGFRRAWRWRPDHNTNTKRGA